MAVEISQRLLMWCRIPSYQNLLQYVPGVQLPLTELSSSTYYSIVELFVHTWMCKCVYVCVVPLYQTHFALTRIHSLLCQLPLKMRKSILQECTLFSSTFQQRFQLEEMSPVFWNCTFKSCKIQMSTQKRVYMYI